MKLKYFIVATFLIFGLGSTAAQSSISYSINLPNKTTFNKTFNSDTLKILAVMADFQTDKDETTFGNGKFGSIYSKDYGKSIIDPLPHNKEYFEHHIQFVKNYYSQVSNGKLNIVYTVLPNVVTVSKTMRNYAPPRNSDDFTNLATFSQEVWSLISSSNPSINYSGYDVFIIFHAGAGNEVTLPGSLGIEKDLPSLFLSKSSLKKIYGQNFEGFNINNSNFKIPNTMIMPETESRESENVLGTTLVELTFNGLLAANIGSFIGLPDLFNTSNGESAIGRFGLMDGESFFSFRGLFPPQPSGWEKLRMGWAKAYTVEPGNFNVSLIADLAATISDTVILKIPITSKEYFLVENRNRDVNNDGAIVKYVSGTDTLQKTFLKDDIGFNNNDVDSLSGVLIGLDEFDWALPGNGILIWHIDENIIDAKIDSNKINADKDNKGIFIEEADGIFDIGEKFITVIGDVIIGQGSDNDFWFKSNSSEFYENRFAPDTRPNTNSNTGANSFITMSDFSTISNKMSFNISYGDSLIVPLINKHLNLPSKKNHLTYLSNYPGATFSIVSDSTMYLVNNSGEIPNNIVNIFNGFSLFKTAYLFTNSNNIIVGINNNTINILVNDGTNFNLVKHKFQKLFTTPPVIRKNINDEFELLVGTADGFIYTYQLASLTSPTPVIVDSLDTKNGIVHYIASSKDYYTFVGELPTTGPLPTFTFGDSKNHKFIFNGKTATSIVMTKNKNSDYISSVSTNDKIYVFNNGSLINNFNYGDNQSSSFTFSLSLTDLKNDGNNYLLYNYSNSVFGRSLKGINADTFPYTDKKEIGFKSNVISADFFGTDNAEIISVTKDGRIYALDGSTSNVVEGFPLNLGKYSNSTLTFFTLNGKSALAVLDDDNYFYIWSIASTTGDFIWSEENGNTFNSNYLEPAKNINVINSFLPQNRSYNYPNPVYGSSTNIRYFVNEDSKINIKIFDISGDLVAELNDNAHGGFDNETVWNVSNVQSGVYFARIEANGNSGRTETNIIKIAVVK